MSIYEYQGVSGQGEAVRGKIQANDTNTARVLLQRQGYRITKLKESRSDKRTKRLKRGQHKLQDMVLLTRQLAAVTKAGLPLIEGLSIISEQIENQRLKNALDSVMEDVKSGEAFATALGKHPRVFDRFVVSMVRAGEASGMLDEVLDQVAEYLEKMNKLQKKVRSALTYPAFVLAFAFALIVFMGLQVIPQFVEMFQEMEAELPLITRITIGFSNILRYYGIFLLILLAIGVFLFRKFLRTNKGKAMFDRITIKIPKIGDLLKKVSLAKFSRTLSTLLGSGVNIISAMEIVEKTTGNVLYEEAIRNARVSIQQGESFAHTLSDREFFPVMIVKMIDIGEKTGALENMLSKVSEFYEEEVNIAVENITSLIEPMLIIFLGGAVGFIIVSIFFPMIRMIEEIS